MHLKSDSFVVESNMHFPTDYNLLWDSARKCLDTVSKIMEKHGGIEGWRKMANWGHELKGLMRELGKASNSGGKNKQDRMVASAGNYLRKARALLKKLNEGLPGFPIEDFKDLSLVVSLEYFIVLLDKHIELVDRRVLKGEKIPHGEKLFSIFEQYTEWVKKGKLHPNVELGKKLLITTDQFDLIVDYQLLDNQQDRGVVAVLADRLLSRYDIASWSFDKGFWSKDNKALLQTEIPQVVMPKLGKRTEQEKAEENKRPYKRLKNRNSAIESNINELGNRGPDRCPDRGINHYRRYVGLGACAYNLKKIGRQILKLQALALEKGECQKAVA